MPDKKVYWRRRHSGKCAYCGKKPFVKEYIGCRDCLDRQNERRKKAKRWVDPKLELIKLFGKTKLTEKV